MLWVISRGGKKSWKYGGKIKMIIDKFIIKK